MKLNPEPFDKIKSGKKLYELRLYDEKRKNICIGDLIEFTKQNGAEKCLVKVTALYRFDFFADLYKNLPLEQCGYDIGELDKADPSDMEQYYPKEKQERYGVVAIKIELMEKQRI